MFGCPTGRRTDLGDCGLPSLQQIGHDKLRSLGVLCVTLLMLSGCGLLPHDGPTIDAVESGASGAKGGYSLVELDARTAALIDLVPKTALLGLGNASSSAPVDLIGVGDGLTVTLLDRGQEALLSPATNLLPLGTAATNLNQTLPKLQVDKNGDIPVPYAGQIHVEGLTTTLAAKAIESSLAGKMISPQAIVSMSDNVANSVTVVGEVRSPGRYPLFDGNDRLLDVLAESAGATHPPADTRVAVTRGDITASVSLDQLLNERDQNIRLAPRDQVRVLYAPRRFTTFGALGHDSEVPIEDDSITLASALSRAGGLDVGSANATAVLIFRFERPRVAAALSVDAPVSPKGVPIVYKLNMRNPEELFVANSFEIETGDLIYVPRADLNEIQQFISIVSAASSVAYNVRVTTAVVK
jgi:polysaccharide export outer membrane protein